MEGPSISFPDQPRVKLDRTIADLVGAAREVLSAQGRLRDLLRASHAISAQLDLDVVLRTIVESAQSLCAAEQSALVVLDREGGFERVVPGPGTAPSEASPGGVDPDASAIPGPPVAESSAAIDELVVPIEVRGARYAELRLKNAEGRRFSEENQQLVQSLATTAGFAVEHALLYRDTQQREEFAAAATAVTAAMLRENGDRALALVADRLHTLLAADTVFVALLDQGSPQYTVAAAHGEDPDARNKTVMPLAGSLLERVVTSKTILRLDEAALRAMNVPFADPYGPILALPLNTPDRVLGAVFVTRALGGHSFTDFELEVASEFVDLTSLALELHLARENQGRMRLFEDRGRIARDLHDRVIQQLFATGMQLQSVLGTLTPGPNADRVDDAVTSLDATIAQIRRIIFTLSSAERSAPAPAGRQRLLELFDSLATSLGLEPTIGFTGPVDVLLDTALTDDVLAVITEGVTNAVKHGEATEAEVRVAATSAGIQVSIASNGRPMSAAALSGAGRRSGLANLEQRATLLGGTMQVSSTGDRTVLRWTVPVSTG